VPVLKISVLALLAWTVQYAPDWRRLERARLYRLIEAVGHWSMLDVYVVVLLAATIHFGRLASVRAGTGLLSFAAVVVLTMLATYAFDPKLIWAGLPEDPDAAPPRAGQPGSRP
jgi:paraquat-inducible protein A